MLLEKSYSKVEVVVKSECAHVIHVGALNLNGPNALSMPSHIFMRVLPGIFGSHLAVKKNPRASTLRLCALEAH